MNHRYWLQTQAPAGNWVDSVGTTLEACISHGRYLQQRGEIVRVVKRTDRVLWNPIKDKEEETLNVHRDI